MMGIFEWRQMAAETLAATQIYLRYEPTNQSVLRDMPRKERNAQVQAAQGRVPTHLPLAPEQVARTAAPRAAAPGVATPAPATATPARATATSAPASPAPGRATGMATLAVGHDGAGGYACPNGRQFFVTRCYDQSAQASCQVMHLHQKNNGLNPETAATRAELLTSLSACTLTPVEFGPDGSVSLARVGAAGRASGAAPVSGAAPSVATASASAPATPPAAQAAVVNSKESARAVIAMPSASLPDLVAAGEYLWKWGESKDATEAFRRAVRMSGDPRVLARAWVGFGRSQRKAERLPQAEVALKEAIRLDPGNADAHDTLSFVYKDQGNVAAALASQEAARRLNPGNPWGQMWLGDAYAAMKRTGEAAAAYDKSMSLASGDRDLLTTLSDSYKSIGRFDRAVEALSTSIAVPDDGTIEGIEDNVIRDSIDCAGLGRLLAAQKKYPDVVRLNLARGDCNGFGESLGKGPLGVAYQGLGQPEKAIPLLERELEGFEESVARYESALADGKLAKGDRAIKTELLAENKAEAVLELDALGRAYLALGRKADAQRIARTLQKYDAKLAASLTAQIASKP